MNATVMVCCTAAICNGLQGWWVAMWFMWIAATVVAGTALSKETQKR